VRNIRDEWKNNQNKMVIGARRRRKRTIAGAKRRALEMKLATEVVLEPHDQISLNDGMQALCNPRVPFSQGLSGR